MNDTEHWKPISGYEGLYEISSHGRVKSLRRMTRTGNRSVPERIMKPDIMKGYHCVVLQKDGNVKVFRIHRLVINAFGPEQPTPDHQVNHIDGDKANNRIDNLEWCTPAENTHHAFNAGLRRKHPTKETLDKMSEATKQRWTNEEYRQLQKQQMTELWKKRKERGWTSWKTWKTAN